MTLEIATIVEADVPTCAAVLAEAFDADPLQVYMFPDPAIRRIVSPRQLEPSLRYGVLYGLGLMTVGECRGAAVWLRPGETELTATRAETAGMVAAAHLMGREAAERSLHVWRQFARIRTQEAGPRYWYLLVIGVRPDCQGQGIGSLLMQPILRQADAEALPCFVETVQPRNQGLYERHGFRVVHDGVDGLSGLRLLSFLRAPRA